MVVLLLNDDVSAGDGCGDGTDHGDGDDRNDGDNNHVSGDAIVVGLDWQ